MMMMAERGEVPLSTGAERQRVDRKRQAGRES